MCSKEETPRSAYRLGEVVENIPNADNRTSIFLKSNK